MSAPVRVAVLNDYEVVVAGLAAMLEPFADRIELVEVAAGEPAAPSAEVVLYDAFAQLGVGGFEHARERRTRPDQKVVVLTWTVEPEAVSEALRRGVDGYLPKSLEAKELVDALVRVHEGERVVIEPASIPAQTAAHIGGQRDWPGRREGLTEREAEIVALICTGLTNDQVAARSFLSINTVKSYIRSAYRTMHVESRSQAVLWGIEHGLRRPPHG